MSVNYNMLKKQLCYGKYNYLNMYKTNRVRKSGFKFHEDTT